MKKRSKNLTDEGVSMIIDIIDLWDGPLRWETLIQAIRQRCGQTYTRQALAKKPRIAEAFKRRRRAPTKTPDRASRSPELAAALGRLDRLERQNATLRDENAALLEQFVLWAYNARMRGLTLDYLSQPLPPLDREQTVIKPQRRSPLHELDDPGA